MTNTNVFQFAQPGTFADPLTEVLRNGARALLTQAVEPCVACQLFRFFESAPRGPAPGDHPADHARDHDRAPTLPDGATWNSSPPTSATRIRGAPNARACAQFFAWCECRALTRTTSSRPGKTPVLEGEE